MGTTRQIIFGIDPYREESYIQTLAFASVPDANTSAKAFTCGVVPSSKGTGASLLQEVIWLGTTTATALTFKALDDTVSLDGASTVTAMAVTQRLDPDARVDSGDARAVTQKRFHNANFNGKSPKRTGVTIQHCLDGDPISGDPITWTDLVGDNGDTKLYFEGARGSFIHLKFTDTSTTYNTVVIPPFGIEYTSEGPEREGRDD